MKVAEKDSDRTAEVHLRAGAMINPLAEFGEYVNPDDGAICCYVPVPFEEKQKIWISGRLSGTTQHIWYDAVIDGVHRKASSYHAKKVGFQKNKKLDTNKFLYKTADANIIDVEMVVDEIGTGVIVTQGDMTETVGTIELRVSVTRQLGVEYTPQGIDKYHNVGENGTEIQRAEFKKIRPTLQMVFEQDSALVDPATSRKEQRKTGQPRPGKEPWAIFRFHYRTPESMAKHNLEVSFDPLVKAKDQPEARILQLEPVQPLPVAASKKDDGDAASTKTSSPAPPDTPLSPLQVESVKSTTSTPKKALPIQATKPAKSMALEQLRTMPDSVKAVPDAGGGKLTELSTDRLHDELTKNTDVIANTKDDSAKVIEEKPIESDTIAVVDPKNKPSTANKAPNDADNAAKRQSAATVAVKPKGPQGGNAAPKPAQNKPKPIKTPQNLSDLKPTTTGTPPATPTKRSAPPTTSSTPDNKRVKATPVPAPTTPTILSRISSGSPMGSPRPMSTERKVAELRKARDALRQKRADTAAKQAEVDAKMEPYQQMMEYELERLKMEMMEEEALAAEDEEHLKASEEMLAEFEKAGGDN